MESSESLLTDFDDKKRSRVGERRWWTHWVVFVVFLVVYSMVLLLLLTGAGFRHVDDGFMTYSKKQQAKQSKQRKKKRKETDESFFVLAPAREAVKFHRVRFDGSLGLGSRYTGEPREETESSWNRLFRHYNLRFTAEEMRRMNRSALELGNGGGFYGQLSAYHHLHCLKMLRRVVWHDRYNVSVVEMRDHADHCIEDIRQSLMCHADLSVVTFDWLPRRRKPWPNFHVEQTCVDWHRLDGWAAERSFSIFDQKTLVHPRLGISFPLVDGKIVVDERDMAPVWPDGE
ncbi:hypothetical protein L249_5245 [Ophiocordyceps polyrhachis-furcata BCC 54312]|uniref:Tat pathway signal sequence n=1 Tax=Ophiocordyceps polyrhachis-furcata BCC 54312 TaxID=1330021 RepID=A0A367L8T0_9HYPO|nr:hypothetical protein L249_5245 [Ophiocordyceps polyrhachis-furcata BCC 54312]